MVEGIGGSETDKIYSKIQGRESRHLDLRASRILCIQSSL